MINNKLYNFNRSIIIIAIVIFCTLGLVMISLGLVERFKKKMCINSSRDGTCLRHRMYICPARY